jgi:uncharacterized protein
MVNYEKLINYVNTKQAGHPFAGTDHVERVHNLCLVLAEGLKVDMEVLRVAAYLHDIAVPVFGPTKHNEQAEEVVGNLLSEIGLASEKQKVVFEAIRTHTRYYNLKPTSIEAEILKDADGIDYLGAVGIARGVLRSFKNGKYSGNVSLEGKGILLNLLDGIESTFATKKGKKMANDRIAFIKLYIKELEEELL